MRGFWQHFIAWITQILERRGGSGEVGGRLRQQGGDL